MAWHSQSLHVCRRFAYQVLILEGCGRNAGGKYFFFFFLMHELSQQHQQCKGILGKRGTKGGRNKHPHLRQPGKPLACQFAAWRRQEEEDGGFQAGCRPVAMDIPDSHR